MARKRWLPPECAGYQKVKAPPWFVKEGYDSGPSISYFRKGKVVIRCTPMHCAVHREIRPGYGGRSGARGKHYTYGYDAGSLHSACSSVGGSEDSFGRFGRRKRRK